MFVKLQSIDRTVDRGKFFAEIPMNTARWMPAADDLDLQFQTGGQRHRIVGRHQAKARGIEGQLAQTSRLARHDGQPGGQRFQGGGRKAFGPTGGEAT